MDKRILKEAIRCFVMSGLKDQMGFIEGFSDGCNNFRKVRETEEYLDGYKQGKEYEYKYQLKKQGKVSKVKEGK